MFNVYLPKLLEGRGGDDGATKTLQENLWDVVIYTVGGCPGAIVRRLLCLVNVSLTTDASLRVDRSVSGRFTTRPSVVVSREHTPHCSLLSLLRVGTTSMGCEGEYSWDKSERDCKFTASTVHTRC